MDNKMTAEQALQDFEEYVAASGGSDVWAMNRAHAIRQALSAPMVPELTVQVLSFPESNGKRNWTAMFVRKEKWHGLAGNCGGITICRGELWNRVAYEAECARLLLGERDTQPDILDYGDDIETPEQWAGEIRGGHPIKGRDMLAASPDPVAPDAPSIDDYVNLCAAMYQAAGARNLPVRFLDALSEAQSGETFAHLIQGLLPVSEDEEGAFCPDAKNYESMFMQAVKSIAEISVAVGVPDDESEAANGNDEILHYIGLIKSERDDLRAEVEALKAKLASVPGEIELIAGRVSVRYPGWAAQLDDIAARLREGGA